MIGRKFKKNDVTIAPNVLNDKREKIYPAYLSKHHSNCENQVILLTISNEENAKLSPKDDINGIIFQEKHYQHY